MFQINKISIHVEFQTGFFWMRYGTGLFQKIGINLNLSSFKKWILPFDYYYLFLFLLINTSACWDRYPGETTSFTISIFLLLAIFPPCESPRPRLVAEGGTGER